MRLELLTRRLTFGAIPFFTNPLANLLKLFFSPPIPRTTKLECLSAALFFILVYYLVAPKVLALAKHLANLLKLFFSPPIPQTTKLECLCAASLFILVYYLVAPKVLALSKPLENL